MSLGVVLLHTTTDMHTYTHTHTCTHAHVHAYTRTHIRTHTHTHMHLHVNTHNHQHTHNMYAAAVSYNDVQLSAVNTHNHQHTHSYAAAVSYNDVQLSAVLVRVVLPLGPDAVLHQTERLHGAVHETVLRLAVEEDLGRLRLGREGRWGGR